jgi:hypothetical protein
MFLGWGSRCCYLNDLLLGRRATVNDFYGA